MGHNDTLSFDQYMTLRKLMADIVWYRRTGRIDELSVQLKKNAGTPMYLHCNDAKVIERGVVANHKAAMSEIMSSVSELSDISEETLGTLKVWSDMCFYMKNPRTFDLLCSATFNDSISLQYGPLEIQSNMIPDDLATHGEAIRRMNYYSRIQCGEHGNDFMFLASMGSNMADCYQAFRDDVPMDENDALLMYDLYAYQYGDTLAKKGEAEHPYQWESNLYKYYMGQDFSEEDLSTLLEAEGKDLKNIRVEDKCLATHMSKLSCSPSFQPADLVAKNGFLRGIFDAVARTGYLPAAINTTTGNGRNRQTVRSFVNKYGPEELIPVLDAAYFMSVNDWERKMFYTQRRICDNFVVKRETAEFKARIQNDGNYVADDAFGVRDIDEQDIPQELDDLAK